MMLLALNVFVFWLLNRQQQPTPAPAKPAAKPKPKPPASTSQAFPLSDASLQQLGRPAWSVVTGKSIALDPSKQYAAELQLTGLEATFATVSDVDAKLRELFAWQTLKVFSGVEAPPAAWPGAREPVLDGFFRAIGVPAKAATVERPAQIAKLWSRARIA